MPVPPTRLAIDLSGGLIRVVDGALGGSIRFGSGGTPAGSLIGGKVADANAVGSALRQLLARSAILETRAAIVASDAVAAFRVFRVPQAATEEEIDARVGRELTMDPQQIATQWVDVVGSSEHRLVYAVAWDRSLVRNLTEAARHAGLDVVAVDLKSACIARAVAERSCVVVDISPDKSEIVLIDDSVPRVWHPFSVNGATGEEAGRAMAAPLRTVLRFYERQRETDFAASSPVLITGEQVPPGHVLASLSETVGHPVRPLPTPARVPPETRLGAYLACLGLIMRRTW